MCDVKNRDMQSWGNFTIDKKQANAYTASLGVFNGGLVKP